MEIKIRKMDPYLVKVIDEKANRLGVSRNEYLNDLIEEVIAKKILKNEKRKQEEVLDLVARSLKLMVAHLDQVKRDQQTILTAVSLLVGVSIEDLEFTVHGDVKNGES